MTSDIESAATVSPLSKETKVYIVLFEAVFCLQWDITCTLL